MYFIIYNPNNPYYLFTEKEEFEKEPGIFKRANLKNEREMKKDAIGLLQSLKSIFIQAQQEKLIVFLQHD